jgi:hypothetical protein
MVTDYGAQWAQASAHGPGFLQVSDFAKESRIAGNNNLTAFWYWCTVTNLSAEPAFFDLDG